MLYRNILEKNLSYKFNNPSGFLKGFFIFGRFKL